MQVVAQRGVRSPLHPDPMTLSRRIHAWRLRDQRTRVEVELAVALRNAQHAEAVALGERMVGLAERSFGPDHLEVGVARYTLAAARLAAGDLAGAERDGEIALRTLGDNAEAPSRLEVLRLLASAAQRANLPAAAVARFSDLAAAIEASPHGEARDLELAQIDTHLGLYLVELERLDEAWSRLARALMLVRTRLGARHPRVGSALVHVATHRLPSSSVDEAASRFEEAIAIFEHGGDACRASLGGALHNLADLREGQGRDDEARALWERALVVEQAHWGMEHASLRPTLVRLAQVCERTGSPLVAGALYARAYELAREDLGEGHRITQALAEWKRSATEG